MLKPSFFAFIASFLILILTESVWVAPLLLLLAIWSLVDVLRGSIAASTARQPSLEDEEQELANRIAQVRKALHS